MSHTTFPDRVTASVPADDDKRLKLPERAYRELKRLLLDNDLRPGTLLLEQEVATLLGMSRTPARAAMIRLAEEGFLEIRPRHGIRVLPVSASDMREIYEILNGLESEAAELVARQGLTDVQLEVLHQAVRDMDEALANDELKAWAAADEHFHRTMVDACGNKRLQALIFQYWDQAHRARLATLQIRPKPTSSNEDHMALVEAIAARNPERARSIHREHRVRNGAVLVALLARLGLNV